MKKKILCLLIFTMLISTIPAFADVKGKVSDTNKVVPPSWSEFCPSQYLNAHIIPEFQINMKAKEYCDGYCSSKKKWVKAVQVLTILPAYSCLASEMYWTKRIREENEVIAYWNNRKQLFDAAVATCESAPVDAQASCYMQVRQLELQRKQLAMQNMQMDLMYYNARVQNMNAINQNIQMQNINTNLNNINNNLNRLYYH